MVQKGEKQENIKEHGTEEGGKNKKYIMTADNKTFNLDIESKYVCGKW